MLWLNIIVMRLLTHCLAGVFCLKLLGVSDLASIVLCVIGSVLPDLDIALKLKHRSASHSLVFILPCFLVMPLGVGVSAHVFLDLMTPTGCMLLFPRSDWFIIFGSPLKTGVHDSFICTLLIGGICFL